MPMDDYLSRDFITLLEVFGEVGCKGSHVERRLRQRCVDIDGQGIWRPKARQYGVKLVAS